MSRMPFLQGGYLVICMRHVKILIQHFGFIFGMFDCASRPTWHVKWLKFHIEMQFIRCFALDTLVGGWIGTGLSPNFRNAFGMNLIAS